MPPAQDCPRWSLLLWPARVSLGAHRLRTRRGSPALCQAGPSLLPVPITLPAEGTFLCSQGNHDSSFSLFTFSVPGAGHQSCWNCLPELHQAQATAVALLPGGAPRADFAALSPLSRALTKGTFSCQGLSRLPIFPLNILCCEAVFHEEGAKSWASPGVSAFPLSTQRMAMDANM